jgi:pimeloyl-ACP methyl ester carboxylesterase
MAFRYELIARANGVNLCVETFGDRSDPAVLLIMGTGASMEWWEDEFCDRLASSSRFVIRYDHRDTGQSVTYPVGRPKYTGGDLARDAIGILDMLGVPSAHLVGMSMGGALAQLIALDRPDRVRSLTLISTTAVAGGRSDLPSMSEEDAARFAIDDPDWSDRDAVIDYLTQLAEASASRNRPFDERSFRQLAGRVFDRSRDIAAMVKNHDLIESGEPPSRPLEQLDVPVLILHGEDDPLFPPAHGEALAAAIPGARLIKLERTGHELPRETWDVVVPEILELTSG